MKKTKHVNPDETAEPWAQGIDDETARALHDFKQEHGEQWRGALSVRWMHGSAPALLHRLRNTHGPRWLATFPG